MRTTAHIPPSGKEHTKQKKYFPRSEKFSPFHIICVINGNGISYSDMHALLVDGYMRTNKIILKNSFFLQFVCLRYMLICDGTSSTRQVFSGCDLVGTHCHSSCPEENDEGRGMVNEAIFNNCLSVPIAGIPPKCRLSSLYNVVIVNVVLLLCLGCSKESSPSSGPDGAKKHRDLRKINFSIVDREALYDFGYVEQSAKHEFEFTLYNPTQKDLQIQRVRSGCACMYAVNPPKIIPAGSASSVQLVFLAPNKPQIYDSKLMIQTADRDVPLFALHVKADVGRPLICRPETIHVDALERNTDRDVSVTISNRGTATVRPVYATSSVDGIIAQIPRAEIPPKGSLAIPLKIHLNGESPDPGDALVYIHTDLSSQPQIGVKIQYSLANVSK